MEVGEAVNEFLKSIEDAIDYINDLWGKIDKFLKGIWPIDSHKCVSALHIQAKRQFRFSQTNRTVNLPQTYTSGFL